MRLSRSLLVLALLTHSLALAGCGDSTPAARTAGHAAAWTPSGGPQGASVFVEPDAGASPIVSAIAGAQRSIELEVYLLTSKPVIKVLEQAVGRGVVVQVMLEQHPYGSPESNQTAYNTLQTAGATLRWANPVFQLTHAKFMVIDHQTGYVLTLNLTASSVSSNREYGLVDGDAGDVAGLEAIFQADWNRRAANVTDPHLVVSPLNARGDLTALIAGAHGILRVESEETQDQGLEDALVAAAGRGVQVEVVLSPARSGQDYNLPGERYLAAHGVSVHLLTTPYVHAKILVMDNRYCFVGSENISTASLTANREVGVIVDDPRVIATVSQTFDGDYAAGQRL